MAAAITLKNTKTLEMLNIIMKNRFFQILEVTINTKMLMICKQPTSKWQLARREKVLRNSYFIANTMKINLGNMSSWGFYPKPTKNKKLSNQFTRTIFLTIFLMSLLWWCSIASILINLAMSSQNYKQKIMVF